MHVLMAILTSKTWLQIHNNFCGCGLRVLLNADPTPCLFRAKRKIILSKIRLFLFRREGLAGFWRRLAFIEGIQKNLRHSKFESPSETADNFIDVNTCRKKSAEWSAKPAELTVPFTAADSFAAGYAPLPPRAGLHTPLLSRHSQVVYLFHSPPRILSPLDMRHFPLEPDYILPSSPATPRYGISF